MRSTTIVTGASTGIGLEIVKTLARNDHFVYAGVRKDSDAREVEKIGANVKALIMDVTHPDQLAAAYQKIVAECDPHLPVHLVNNAGIAVAAPIEGVQLQALRDQFEVNVFGAVSACQAFSPLIRLNKGRIVMIGSVSGLVSVPFLGIYSASKFALEAITTSLRMEMSMFGVKVFMVRPGQIATPIWDKNFAREQELLDEMPKEMRGRYSDAIKNFVRTVKGDVPGAISPSRVADAVLDCLEKKNPMETRIVASAKTHLGILAALRLPLIFREKALAKKYSLPVH
jgi:NAD(P)-dependent dehydrogenase (short-subunit alcohol dehydrogenase family)